MFDRRVNKRTEWLDKISNKIFLQVCVMIHSGSRGLGHQVATGKRVRAPKRVHFFSHFIKFSNLIISNIGISLAYYKKLVYIQV